MKNILATSIKNVFLGKLNKHLLVCLVVLFGSYSFFIARAVVAIDQRKDLNKEIQTAQMAVSDLEMRHFNLASSIDMAKAAEFGFVDAKTPDFAYTNPLAETVALSR